MDYTPRQRNLIDAPDGIYVDACPGAGKTHAIIERFASSLDHDPRRGTALLSFTNAVTEEARRRSVGRPELLQVPNFVGTIDSFINRMIVAPSFIAKYEISPTFQSDWRHVAGARFGLKNVQGEFQLDWFDFDRDATARLVLSKVPYERRAMIAALEPWRVEQVVAEASRRWQRNINRGVLDAAASRTFMKDFLGDAECGATIRSLLGARFSEAIVDEVQDCCDGDLELLTLLQSAGVRLILVGDPDQAIYGFRGARSTDLQTLTATLAKGERLSGNFRSSPAICSAVNGLRHLATDPDSAVGRNSGVEHKVQLISYSTPASATKKIRAVVSDFGYAPADAVVLAHGWDKARACAGGGSPSRMTDSRLLNVASVVHGVQDELATEGTRMDSLRLLERRLQQLCGEELSDLSEEEFLAAVGLGAREYREYCLRLAIRLGSPYADPPSGFKTVLADAATRSAIGWSIKGLRLPKDDVWPHVPKASVNELSYSTVHGYKGLESRVVALIIPAVSAQNQVSRDDGLTLWSEGRDGEARRVLYVGVSRAEELLILTAHTSVLAEVQRNLTKDNVDYEVSSHE